jgi:hypothetical protein
VDARLESGPLYPNLLVVAQTHATAGAYVRGRDTLWADSDTSCTGHTIGGTAQLALWHSRLCASAAGEDSSQTGMSRGRMELFKFGHAQWYHMHRQLVWDDYRLDRAASPRRRRDTAGSRCPDHATTGERA